MASTSFPVLWAPLGDQFLAGFTQRGSAGPHAPWNGFNLGLGVGDDPERVRSHRRAVGDLWGVPVAFATQVHGAEVLNVDGVGALSQGDRDTVGIADGLVTTRTDVALAVLVADCVPVLLADGHARVIGVAHAGRQGFNAGIIASVVSHMVACGASPSSMMAIVGPAICGACYEVPEQMRSDIVENHPATWSQTRHHQPSLDLPAGVGAELERLGIDYHHLDICTTEDHRFFSHRGDVSMGSSGRFAGIVKIKA